MIGLTVALLMVRIDTPLTSPRDACELGRPAIAELRPVGGRKTYIELNPKRSELLRLCPELRRYRPKNVVAADANARLCASGKVTSRRCHGPRSGVYSIDRPRIVAEPDHAVTEVSVQCGGTCGRGYVIFYVRTAKGWHRDGEPRMLWVS